MCLPSLWPCVPSFKSQRSFELLKNTRYRRFGALNGRNLLYLQSELREIESQLHDLDADANDISKGNDVWSTPRSWYALNRAGGEKHLEIVMKLRLRLDEYSRINFS